VSLVLVLTPIGHPLGFVPVPVEVLVSMAGVLVAYVVATELGKSWFYRRAEQRTAT
jgi:hypothetical protein